MRTEFVQLIQQIDQLQAKLRDPRNREEGHNESFEWLRQAVQTPDGCDMLLEGYKLLLLSMDKIARSKDSRE